MRVMRAAAVLFTVAAAPAAHATPDGGVPPVSPAAALPSCTITPTALTGERFPAFAPFPSIRAVLPVKVPVTAWRSCSISSGE